MRWPARNNVKNKARKKFPVTKTTKKGKTTTRDIWHYTCAMCGPEIWYRDSQVQMDHIRPIVNPLEGFTNFEDYIDNMLADEDNWQRLCKPHHEEKTGKEQALRQVVKDAKKSSKK